MGGAKTGRPLRQSAKYNRHPAPKGKLEWNAEIPINGQRETENKEFK
jgi:hypothetical protein